MFDASSVCKKVGNAVSKGRFFSLLPSGEGERERERDAPYFLRPRPGLRRDELFQVSDGIVLVALHAYFLPEAVVEDHFDHDDVSTTTTTTTTFRRVSTEKCIDEFEDK